MKKTFYLLLSLFCIETGFAQQFPTFDWARVASEGYPTIPLVGNSYGSDIRIIKRDAAGNIYISGQINKAMKFANQDIYAQNFNGSNYGNYFMKLNPTGETILWVKTMVYAGISDFEIDSDGFIYAVSEGGGGGTIKYGDATIAGGSSYPNVEVANYYKINASNGNLVWMKNAGTPGFAPSIYPFVEADNNALYMTDCLGPNANNSTTARGYRLIKILKSTANADPDEHIENKAWILDKTWFAANVDPLFENHIFDMKLTNDKQSLWVYLMTGDAWIDDFSNQLYDTRDMILLRLDNLNNATPTIGYKKKFTTLIPLNKGDLQIDSQGNILVTGGFQPDANRYVQNSNGKADIVFGGITYEFPFGVSKQYIAKLSPTGTETWIKFYDAQSPYQFRSLTLDNSDNMYVCQGSYPSMTTIGSFTSINDPWWVMKMKPNGDQVYMWSNEEGGSNNSDPVLCATGGTDVIIGTNGGGGKYGTKEIVGNSSFVISNLKHSGTTKPFEELKKLKDINTGADVLSLYSSNPNRFTELGGELAFFGWMFETTNPNQSGHLLKTDGTENGTVSLAKVALPNVGSGYANEMNNTSLKTPTHLYFEGSSNDVSNIRQTDLWKSDGTAAGTVKFKSFAVGSVNSNANGLHNYDIQNMVFANGLVFFTMSDATNSKVDLWKTDGTEAGTVRLYEGCIAELAVYNNYVYYFIKGVADQFGNIPYTLRRHNGTSGGFVKNLATTSSNATNIPRFFGVVNNQLLFTADGTIVLNSNNVNSGMELWKTDGTGAGTVIVKDINPETPNNFPTGPFANGKSSITYGSVDHPSVSNVKISALSSRYIIYNNLLYFGADDGVNGRELWKSDGTEAGTTLIKNIGGTFYDPYNTAYVGSSDPVSFFVFQNNIVFKAIGSANGNPVYNLYKTDGSENGTTVLKNGGLPGDAFSHYTVLNNILYFAAYDQPNSLIHPTYNEPLTSGIELWTSDGSTVGTKQLKNMMKGWLYGPPIHLTTWNGSLYYTFYNVVNPYHQVPRPEAEPWKFTPAPCTNPAPAGPLATVPTILASYPATIKANGCLGIVKWYAEASGGSPIFVGDNYTTPLLNTTTTYYLSCTFNNCESQRSPTTVMVNQPNCTTLPAVPSSSGGNVVSGNSITLTAIGCTEQTRWYGQSSGGAILAQTATFTTPTLSNPTTYYPVCFLQGCESPRTVLDNITISPTSGMALDFDGVDDFVTIPANSGFNSLSFTMESWVRFDVNNRGQLIMSSDQRWMGYYNYGNAGNALSFGFTDNNGTQRIVNFSFTPTIGSWYHLAGTFNNSTKEMSFYINGELQDIQTLNSTPGQINSGIKLGINYSTNESFLDGRIEEARYWNIARTETQIGSSYNTELSGNESGLVFYYKFDEAASALDVEDCSPNHLHGTRTGATGTNNKPQFFNTSVVLTDITCGINNCIPPNISIGSNAPVCLGETLNLTSSGGATYSWVGPNSFTSTARNPSIVGVSNLAAGTYSVTVLNAEGCPNTASINVIIKAIPIINLTNNSPICAGNTLNISALGSGQSGLAGSFNAANNQYVNINQSIPSDNFTIEMRIKTNQANAGLFQAGNEPNEGLSGNTFIFLENGILKARIIPQAIVGFSSEKTLNDDNWHHIAITHTTTGGVGSTIYVDGVLASNYPTSVGSSGYSKFQLGTENNLAWQNGNYRQFFTGLMDNVRIWNVVRTNTEIAANAGLENPTSSTGMIYQQKFENNVNATVGTNGTTPNGLSYVAYVSKTYAWTGPNSFSSTSQNPSISNATTSSSGIYTVNVTELSGCSTTVTIAVTVNPLPTATLANQSICAGKSANLTPTGLTNANAFIWSNGATSSSISVSPTVTTTYTLTITSTQGCTTTATAVVTVNPLPTATLTNQSICAWKTANLTPTGLTNANAFIWSNGATSSSISVSPIATTTYTLTVTSTQGCTTTATAVVTVNPLPTATLANQSICAGKSANLTPTGLTNANAFIWSTGATSSSITLSPNVTTTYTLTVSSAQGCTATATTTVTVNPLPTATLANQSICSGKSTNLTPTGLTNANAFIWSTGATSSSITLSPNVTTTYTLTVSSAQGCTATATTTVTVNPLSTVTLANQSICAGKIANLTPTGLTNANAFIWNNGATSSSISVSPIATTTYTLTITSTQGCTTTATAVVTVNPLPTATLANQSICAGKTANLTPTGLTNANAFIWSNGATSSSISVNPIATTTYTLTITSTQGCTTTATAVVTVNPLPTATLANQSICAGKTANLTPTGLTNANAFIWSNGATSSSISVSPIVTTTYTLTITSTQGCTTTATAVVTVNPLPTATLVNQSICAGKTANLTPTGLTNANAFIWSNGATSSSISVSPTVTTTYTLTITSTQGCTTTATAVVTVNPLPTATLTNQSICAGKTANLTPTGLTNANAFIWSNGATSSSISVSPTVTTTYTLTVTSTQGCTTTATAVVTVNPLPNITATSNSPQCIDGMLNLISTNAVTYIWSGPNSFSATGATPSFTASTSLFSGTYTVTATNNNGCINNATTLVTITTPVSPISSNVTISVGSSASLTASGCTTYKWYDQAIGGSLLFTGNPFVTPNLNINTTYHVACLNAPCPETSRTAVSITITPCPSSLTISSNYTTGDNLTRQASATNGLITATNQITNTAKITYQSKAILLSPGFKVETTSGGFFKAEIGGCN